MKQSVKNLVGRLTRECRIACVQVAVDQVAAECFPRLVDLSRYPLDEAVSRFGSLLMQLTRRWC